MGNHILAVLFFKVHIEVQMKVLLLLLVPLIGFSQKTTLDRLFIGTTISDQDKWTVNLHGEIDGEIAFLRATANTNLYNYGRIDLKIAFRVCKASDLVKLDYVANDGIYKCYVFLVKKPAKGFTIKSEMECLKEGEGMVSSVSIKTLTDPHSSPFAEFNQKFFDWFRGAKI